jgi:beta-N-acetylhexosaminidase
MRPAAPLEQADSWSHHRMTARSDPALVALANGVLWPGFCGVTAPDWAQRALEDGLAGVVYFGHNIDPVDADQPRALSEQLRGIRSDVLIGSDEEGGNVTRLEAAVGSSLPSHAQLGRLDDADLTQRVGAALGRRAAHAGINIALAPVADVNTDPRNPVIGVRSFGADAALVSRHVAAMVAGIQGSGVAACVKHFPGHGDTHVDSHHGLPRVQLSWAQIEREHLPPFRAACDAGVRAVMTAHIVIPEFGDLPATLNRRVLARLREEGFDGVIVTDALDMAAIATTYGSGAGAVRAIAAGADLLCIGNPSNLGPKGGSTSDEADYREVRDALLDALDDGTLAAADLERAVERVRALAAAVEDPPVSAGGDAGGAGSAGDPSSAGGTDDTAEALLFAAAVRRSFRVSGGLHPLADETLVLDLRRAASIAVASTVDVFTAAFSEHTRVTKVVVDTASAGTATGDGAVQLDTEIADAIDAALRGASASSVVVLTDAIGTDGSQQRALGIVALARRDAVVVNSGVEASDGLPLAVIDTFGAGRLSAAGVVGELSRGAR